MALIIITGHIGKLDELKYIPSGTAVLRFSLACNTGYGEHKRCTWYECQLWGKRAETISKFLAKGAAVTVVGEPSSREWTSEKTGKSGVTFEIRVNEIVLLGKKDEPQREEAPPPEPANTEPQQGDLPSDSEVPF
jgi:single-strand DNA-binding protein